jgi:methyl-accepting chemotaxis protein
LFLFASQKIQNGIYEQAYNGMHATTLAVRNTFEIGTPGEYHLDENGQLWKGDTLNISQALNIADSIKSSTGMEFTIFYKDTRYLTSITDEKGNRQINTKASEKVVNQVLNKGLDYYDTNVNILGTEYIAYYIPIFQENAQTPIGMIFLGLAREGVLNSIRQTQFELLIIVFIFMIAVFIVSYILVQKLVGVLTKSIQALHDIANGQLGLEVNNKLLSRSDEIGDIYRSITDLDNKMSTIIGNIKEQSNVLADTSSILNISARDVADSVTQVDTAVQEIAIATSSQSDETQIANKNVEIMGTVVEETSSGIMNLDNTTTKISEASTIAASTLTELDSTMKGVINSIELIYEQTNSTADSVQKISEVTNLITDIAEQTTLLSLSLLLKFKN